MILFTANEYQLYIRQQLEYLSPTIISEIQTIISEQSNKNISGLDIEICSDKLNGRLPVRVTLYYGNNGCEIIGLASTIRCVLPAEQIEVLRQFNQAGVEITEVTYQTLIEWFADCWDQAGGRQSNIHTQISIHDDIEAFDLNHHHWIQKKVVETNDQRNIRG